MKSTSFRVKDIFNDNINKDNISQDQINKLDFSSNQNVVNINMIIKFNTFKPRKENIIDIELSVSPEYEF